VPILCRRTGGFLDGEVRYPAWILESIVEVPLEAGLDNLKKPEHKILTFDRGVLDEV
jgi:hypothetical protein